MALIGIACADIHFFKFQAFNKDDSRLNYSLKAMRVIMNVATEYKVPILFMGDLFHTPKEVENETLTKVWDLFINYRQGEFFAISGNHDMSKKNGWKYKSPSYLDGFKHLNCFRRLDYFEKPYPIRGDNWLQGLPYMNSGEELMKGIEAYRKEIKKVKGYKILMLHTDCPGQKGWDDKEHGEAELPKKIDEYFRDWDLVLFGHVHRPQKISKRCYMLGSPIHQVMSDQGEMGYWRIYNDRPPLFVGLAEFPRFIKLKEGEKAKDDFNYYIPPEDVSKIEEIEAGDFNITLSRTKLAKRYLRVKGIKDPRKKEALINTLNSIE